MDGEQIKAALIAVREECNFPPTIAEFRRFASASVSHPSHQALPSPKAEPMSEEIRQQILGEFRINRPAANSPIRPDSSRCAADIASGRWTVEQEVIFQMHARYLRHTVSNPLNLDLLAIPAYPHGVDPAEIRQLAAAIAQQFGVAA